MAFIAAVRPIDLAIFGTLSALWLGGAVFIVTLYRWIARFEREQDPQGPPALPIEVPKPAPTRAPSRIIARPATAREALARN